MQQPLHTAHEIGGASTRAHDVWRYDAHERTMPPLEQVALHWGGAGGAGGGVVRQTQVISTEQARAPGLTGGDGGTVKKGGGGGGLGGRK